MGRRPKNQLDSSQLQSKKVQVTLTSSEYEALKRLAAVDDPRGTMSGYLRKAFLKYASLEWKRGRTKDSLIED